MNKTLYTIYWLDNDKNPHFCQMGTLQAALAKMEEIRKNKYCSSPAMSCENIDQVGKLGVDCVKDGKTPDGVEYTWVKRRDGGQ